MQLSAPTRLCSVDRAAPKDTANSPTIKKATSLVAMARRPNATALGSLLIVSQFISLAALGLIPAAAYAAEPTKPAYTDTTLAPEVRAADLVSRMSLREKTEQMINDAPAIPRLGIREYNWWNEGLHGVAAAGEATVFPQAVGMAATFDEAMIGRTGTMVSVEFRAKYVATRHRFGGSDWFGGLTVWSPNINIFRDPRWGRGQETYGEDPYLTARLGVAYVRGLQGDDPRYLRVVATPKHYAVHSGPEPSRHRDDIHPSRHDLEDTYLPAFRATIVEGQAVSIMCAYNAVDGIPACANEDLLVDHLRRDWKFNGFVVSDCDAIGDIYYPTSHHYRATPEEGVAVGIMAGTDLICGNANEAEHLENAVLQGKLPEQVLNTAVERLFTARMRLGQFDPPSSVFPNITARDFDTEANRAFARQVAEASMVLLKNKENLLPLRAAPRSIAVIGPNADSVDALTGNYNGTPSHPVTVLAGLRARFPDAAITYTQGTGLIDPVLARVPDSALCLDAGCTRSGLSAERFGNQGLTGDVASRTEEPNARVTWTGEQKSTSMRWTGYVTAPETGEYRFKYQADGGYRIWVNDTLIVDAWRVDWRPSIATGSIRLEAGKRYALRVEAFQRGVDGDEALMWSLPSDPAGLDAVANAAAADVVVFVAGLSHRVEGEEMHVDSPGFSGGDRTSLDLPPVQEGLLKRVVAAGKPVVLVLMNGSALSVNWADTHVPAIIEAWYPGGQGGDAVARLIAGDFSPAGRLPVTFYRSATDLPDFSNYDMKGRTYRYFTGEALYPFGYGLSYTSFGYGKARVSSTRVGADQSVTVSVDVTNTGGVDGDEVVQLYLSRKGVSGAPIRALAGFQRVHLKQGETRTVTFTLDERALSTVDTAGVRSLVPGKVDIWLGGGQPDQRAGLQPSAGVKTSLTITAASSVEP